jgi:Na+/phosphate symporter
VGDNAELLIRAIRTMIEEGIPFTDRALREINSLFEKTIELVECVRDAIITRNRVLIRHVLEEGQRCESLANEYALFHQQRLIEGVCMPKASFPLRGHPGQSERDRVAHPPDRAETLRHPLTREDPSRERH